jgi:dynein heavy chain
MVRVKTSHEVGGEVDHSALLEVQLELVSNETHFVPDLERNPNASGGLGLRDVVQRWIEDILGLAQLIHRVEAPTETFLQDVRRNERIATEIAKIETSVNVLCELLQDHRTKFEWYSHLYAHDLHLHFELFLRGLSNEADPLLCFEERLNSLKLVEERLLNESSYVHILWVRLDCRPLIQALQTWLSKWSFAFTKHLIASVVSTITRITGHIERADILLSPYLHLPNKYVEDDGATKRTPVREFQISHETLFEVMAYIRETSELHTSTELSFGPLRAEYRLLESFGFELSTWVTEMLETLPRRWQDCIRNCMLCKSNLEFERQAEVKKLSELIEAFNDRFASFVKQAKANLPLSLFKDTTEAYALIDTYFGSSETSSREELPFGTFRQHLRQCEELKQQQALFDLDLIDAGPVHDFRVEIVGLKRLWDLISLIRGTFDAWGQVRWKDADPSEIGEQLPHFEKLVATTTSAWEVTSWSLTRELIDMVANMARSVQLLVQLRNPAMRERHWKHLARVTGTNLSAPQELSLKEILSVGIHRCSEQVADTLTRAVMEESVEDQLKYIDSQWSSLNLVVAEFSQQRLPISKSIQNPASVYDLLEDSLVKLEILKIDPFVAANAMFTEEVRPAGLQLVADVLVFFCPNCTGPTTARF